MNTITRTAEQRLKIAAGQTFRAWVETDAMLIVTSGTLMLHAPPMSLAETLVALRMRLGPETAQRFERSGWMALTAVSATEARLLTPEPMNARISVILAALD